MAVDEIDYAIESDEPLASPVPRPPGDVAREIGGRVARLVPERRTLQLGIGAIPDAVLASCSTAAASGSGRRCSATASSPWRSRRVDPDTPITASFAFGSEELYDWADRNERVRMLRTEKTNDPA